MRVSIFAVLFFCIGLNATTAIKKPWVSGESFLWFLKRHNISKDLYFNLPQTDKELCAEIIANSKYTVLVDGNDVKQILIPISHKMQIHIRKENTGHSIDFIAISSKTIEKQVLVTLSSSIYKDMYDKTKNRTLGGNLVSIFGKQKFKIMQKGDKIAINYTQAVKDGKTIGSPTIVSAMIEVNKKAYFRFRNPYDERYYNKKGQTSSNFFLKVPLRYKRISSPFSYRRFHPILKKYRAHHGIDYAAPRGRQIYASGDGKVAFRGRKGGYGKTIIIQHKHGYKTLYAHMRGFRKGIRVGKKVSQGSLIGYVGSTGRSTGPHLHFGLYAGSKAINPNRVVRKALKTVLKGKEKKLFDKVAKQQLNKLQMISVSDPTYEPYENIDSSCYRGKS